MERNRGCALDFSLLNNVHVNKVALNECAQRLIADKKIQDEYEIAWLLRAVTCIDLTTLGGDDSRSNVIRLCRKAAQPIKMDIFKKFGFEENDEMSQIKTAAVCVYPSRVKDAVNKLKELNMWKKINVASVAAGFPSGQMPLKTRLEEIKYAVGEGANEIDIVINRTLVLTGKWDELYDEIKQMREACGDEAHLKTILAVGELGSYNNIYKASLVAMMAGSDFIKTSTGKETVNATLPFGLIMSRAIKEYYKKTGYKVGLKPAGGIRTGRDAINWLILVKEVLGREWLNNDLFRIGASGLLGDIETSLYTFAFGIKPEPYLLTMG